MPPLASCRARTTGVALLGLAAAALALPAVAAPVRAVVLLDGARALHGVDVVRSLPALGMVVVDGSPAAVRRLAAEPGVRGVSPDGPLQLTGSAAAGPGVPAATGLGGRAGCPGAGRGVRVAVVDTGVSDTVALDRASGRLVDAYDSSDADGPLVDGYGHGTFMASVLAGGPVDDGAPLGVAPGATVLVVRVAEPDGSTSLSQVLGGLDWVASHPGQVDVASLSFSHERPGTAYGADPLTDAVDAMRDAGVTVVVSAGNDAGVVGDPGFTPRALTVGAADLTGKAASVAAFSGSAQVAGVHKPDVVANGVSVLGLLPPDSVIAKANPGSRSGALWRGTGTSQATAVTSGVAALLLAKRPDATPAQVKAALRNAARPLPGSRDGAGLLRVTSSTAISGGGGTPAEPAAAGGDASGESGFDANSWSANSWSANSWSANSWSANSWSANSWSANSGSANSWSANSWSRADGGDR